MSKRRRAGDTVRIEPSSGYAQGDAGMTAELQPGDTKPCMFDCGDRECRMWGNAISEDKYGRRHSLASLCECEMLDAGWVPPPRPPRRISPSVSCRIQGDRIGRAVLAGWGFATLRPPRSDTERGCVWVRRPGRDDWAAEKGGGERWLAEALDGAGVPE